MTYQYVYLYKYRVQRSLLKRHPIFFTELKYCSCSLYTADMNFSPSFVVKLKLCFVWEKKTIIKYCRHLCIMNVKCVIIWFKHALQKCFRNLPPVLFYRVQKRRDLQCAVCACSELAVLTGSSLPGRWRWCSARNKPNKEIQLHCRLPKKKNEKNNDEKSAILRSDAAAHRLYFHYNIYKYVNSIRLTHSPSDELSRKSRGSAELIDTL